MLDEKRIARVGGLALGSVFLASLCLNALTWWTSIVTGGFVSVTEEDFMRCRMLVLAAGLAALATPALADFYIVQDSGTKRCSIVEQRPTTQTSVIVGDGKVYTSRTEAEGALRTVKVCDSGGTVGGPAVAPTVPAPR
jgi:hypothetical protein